MPTYEYECTRCNHVFEVFQSISAPPRKRCPECRGKVVRRIGTGAGLLFKGSGFYITDYRSDSYKKSSESDKKHGSGHKEDTGSAGKKDAPAAAASGSKAK